MTQREIFQTGIRILGLVILYQVLMTLPERAVEIIRGAFSFNIDGWIGAIRLICPVILVWWLIRGAPWLVKTAFDESKRSISQPE